MTVTTRASAKIDYGRRDVFVSSHPGEAGGRLAEPIAVPAFDPGDPDQIGNISAADVLAAVLPMEGNADAGRELFRAQACIHCHTYANGQRPKGPHLVDIGKRSTKQEMLMSTKICSMTMSWNWPC